MCHSKTACLTEVKASILRKMAALVGNFTQFRGAEAITITRNLTEQLERARRRQPEHCSFQLALFDRHIVPLIIAQINLAPAAPPSLCTSATEGTVPQMFGFPADDQASADSPIGEEGVMG